MAFGEALREAREEHGLSEKEVADKLQISVKFIKALEEGGFVDILPRVYARGFLKKYAEYLGFSSDDVLGEFDREFADFHQEPASLAVVSAKGGSASGGKKDRPFPFLSLLSQRRIVLFFFLASLVLVGVYFLYGFRFVIGEPRLTISSPSSDTATESEVLQVSGRAEEGADVFLNGRALPVSDLGEFRDSALLLKGLNELEFEVKNRFGKIRKEVRYVFVK